MFARKLQAVIVTWILSSVLWAGTACAQYTTASLSGVVVDTSGAAVPGAKVTVQNTGTGMTRIATTSQNGSYLFPALPVGTYRLTVEKAGFSTYAQQGITLDVNQAATQSVRLQLGSITQQVSVSANAQMLPTETSTVSQLVDQRRIVDLPLNGRQAQNLLFLAQGTVDATKYYCGDECQGGVYPGAQWGVVSGGGPGNVSYEMDGADHNDNYINSNFPFPNPDAIQEFNVQSNNMSAEYGNSATVVNVVTKSGTNQFHGDAFEFVRNGDLNARNFFAPTQDTLKRNQFGGTFGGPIKKDKLFFFGTYQGTRIRTTPSGVIEFVPTQAERAGDFSALSTKIKDPLTGTAFSNNQIPTGRLSAPAQFFLQHIPLPNGPNGQLTFAGPKAAANDDQFMPKIDYVTGKNHLSGRYFFTNYSLPPDLAAAKNNVLATDACGIGVRVQTVAASDMYSASPTLLFSTWFGYDRSIGRSLSGATFNFPDAGVQIAVPAGPKAFESVGVSGFFNAASGHPGEFDRNDWKLQEIVAWQKGHHEFHFGGELFHLGTPEANTYQESGAFTFGSALSGSNLSDFILGLGANFSQSSGIYYNYGGFEGNLFAQDNWRVNRKLLLNLGIRWDPYFPYTDVRNRVPCYRPGLKSQRYPNAPVGLIYAGDPGCPAGGTNGVSGNFAPRAGFAYHLAQNTVVRGGGGIYYTLPNTDQINGFSSVAPFAPVFNLVDVSFQNPYASVGIANPFPASFGSGALPGPSATFVLPVSINGNFPSKYYLPTVATWNLMVEQQVGTNWTFSAGYYGNRGYHLSSNALGRQEENPSLYVPGRSTQANTQSRRLNPNFTSVSLYPVDHNSSYEALQLNVEKRFTHGFSVLANYTFSKMLDDNGPIVDPFDLHYGWGISADNLPHVFHLSAVWNTPHVNTHGLASALINDWEVTGINSWQSGFPFTVYSGVNNSFSGVGSDRADFIGSNYKQAVLGDRPHGQMVQEYFNTSLFVANAVGTFGDGPRNAWQNPGLFDTDLAALKNFKVTEQATLQFRAEFFNAFNNVNFSVPGLGSGNPNESAAGTRLGTATFGKLTHAADPRILQFGLKFIF